MLKEYNMRLALVLIAMASITSGSVFAEMSANSGKSPANDAANESRVVPPSDTTGGRGVWTDERMRNAKPKPVPQVDRSRNASDRSK
jgi:hypothetical protein